MMVQKEKEENVIVEKSFNFSVRIVKFYLILIKRNKVVEPLLKQLLRSGTSIGANITEAQSAVTKKDFINKLGIALKESKETDYWLKIFVATGLIDEKEYKSMHDDALSIIKLLTAIIKSAKANN